MQLHRIVVSFLAGLIVAGPSVAVADHTGWIEALFAPNAELWQRWTVHDPNGAGRIDHAVWDKILARYLRADGQGVNRFAYGAVTQDDKAALDGYIAARAATPIDRYDRAEQFAFWVNLYNALTVKLMVEHYPVAGIREIDISPGWFADGPWGKKLVTVAGEAVSLNDIEHRILRPIWRDPRIHYAVNCAAIGCPNLRRRAFTAANAEAELAAAAREFVNSPRAVRLADGRLTLSSIYVWFQEDFGGSDAGTIAHIRQFAEPSLAAALDGLDHIDAIRYDWSLNDTADANPDG